MKFSVNVKILAQGLKRANLTVACNDDQNPTLRNFALIAEGGVLTVFATDLQLATVCPMPANISVEGRTTVPADKLVSIINNTSADEIELDLDPSGQIMRAQTGAFKASLMTSPFDDFPAMEPFDDGAAIQTDRAGMFEKLNRITFALTDNEARQNLLAVNIAGGWMQASDTNVTACIEFAKEFDGVQIPHNAVKDLVRVLRQSEDAHLKVQVSKSHLLFKLGGDVFMARRKAVQFPDVNGKVIKPTEKITTIFAADKAKLKAAVTRVSVTCAGQTEAICFEVGDSNGKTALLRMSSQDERGNTSSEELEIEYTGKATKLYFVYFRLLDIIGAHNGNVVTFRVPDSEKLPVRFEEDAPRILLFLNRTKEQVVAAAPTAVEASKAADGAAVDAI